MPRPRATWRRVCSVQPLTARVLLGRGMTDADSARRFLTPSIEHLHDPLLLTGMRKPCSGCAQPSTAKEKILIYGDYDVDGTVSVVILKKAIELAGGEASFHVPHRLTRRLRHASRGDRARGGDGRAV